MWTHVGTSIERNKERPQFFSVALTFRTAEGKEAVYTEPYVPDQLAIPKLAADWLRQHNKVDAQEAAPLTHVEVLALTDAILNPRQAEPTEEQQAAGRFAADAQALGRMLRAADLGLKDRDGKDVSDLRDSLKARLDATPSYLSLL